PRYAHDPATPPDCLSWHNNIDTPCPALLTFWNITPAEFLSWNPSTGPQCTLHELQSYCLMTHAQWVADGGEEYLSSILRSITGGPTTTATTTKTSSRTTTTTSTPAASPTEWEHLGCYVEDPALPLMDRKMEEGGLVTVKRCQDVCWKEGFGFAGVQEGDECWCGTYVGGLWAGDQGSCDVPCAGDAGVVCGGRGLLSVYRPVGDLGVLGAGSGTGGAGTASGTGTGTGTGTRLVTSTADSGARRYGVLFF
ncbi:hypothetical protein QBC34DRAFT_258262, partial [Podospora aff. communis PSN243]